MLKKTGLVALVVVGLTVLGVSVHASGGPGPHTSAECLLCAFCAFFS
jgi:hypothetical protein